MKFIDLFAGVGGFRYGIESINKIRYSRGLQDLRPNRCKPNINSERTEGEPISRQSKNIRCETEVNGQNKDIQENSTDIKRNNVQRPIFSCVYSNEWDKYANSVYRKHYGECDNRDIRTVKAEEIPDHDLLVGGFPCQAFSVAGKRGGFEDTRGTLFFEIARIAKQKQPRLLLLENVKGLLSHDKGRTFGTILNTLDELGYDCQWQVLNSKNFGVPQNRERVFIVGHTRGTPRPKVFPIIGANSKTLKQIVSGGQGNRLYASSGLSTTIASQAGGLGAKTGLYAIPVLTPDRLEKRQNGRRFKTNGEPAFTLTQQDIHDVYDGVKIRRLTPVECERLQGFPDNWTKYGHDGKEMSDTQRYKMMGNAVTTNVITKIMKTIE